MKFKYLLLSTLVVLTFNLCNINTKMFIFAKFTSDKNEHMMFQNSKYERVRIDGVYWIIVYNEEGDIVNKYIDPNQND